MTGARIFRNYDRAGLDAQYNNRARVPEHPALIEAWVVASARARARVAGFRTASYGASAAESIDIFPAGKGGAPLCAFFHGGYWTALDKRDFSHLANAVVPKGVCLAVVNYALIPAVDMDGLIEQCRVAIVWLHAHAREFGADPARIYVSGHSAGGHIVAMLALTDWRARGLRADAVTGGVAVSGLFDLEPIRLCYLNEKLGLDAAAAARHSPMRHARPGGPPLVLAVGGAESEEYHRQTEEFATVWKSAGNRVEVLKLPGLNHFTIATALGDPTSPLAVAALRQMGIS